jgi:uncharacterized membrane protein AbrB (regulator of aidB expression)
MATAIVDGDRRASCGRLDKMRRAASCSLRAIDTRRPRAGTSGSLDMCDIVLDALILLGLVKWLGDDEIDLVHALVLALVGAVVSIAIGWWLQSSLDDWAFLVGKLVAGVGIGGVLFIKYGVEMKRAFVIGVVFVIGGFLLRLAMVFALATFLGR